MLWANILFKLNEKAVFAYEHVKRIIGFHCVKPVWCDEAFTQR
jgi:hypothetical protein